MYRYLALTCVRKLRFFLLFFLFFISYFLICTDPPHAKAPSIVTCTSANIHSLLLLQCFAQRRPEGQCLTLCRGFRKFTMATRSKGHTGFFFCRHEAHLIYSCMYLPQGVSFYVFFSWFSCIYFVLNIVVLQTFCVPVNFQYEYFYLRIIPI